MQSKFDHWYKIYGLIYSNWSKLGWVHQWRMNNEKNNKINISRSLNLLASPTLLHTSNRPQWICLPRSTAFTQLPFYLSLSLHCEYKYFNTISSIYADIYSDNTIEYIYKPQQTVHIGNLLTVIAFTGVCHLPCFGCKGLSSARWGHVTEAASGIDECLLLRCNPYL